MKRSVVAFSVFALFAAGCSAQSVEVNEPGSTSGDGSQAASKVTGRLGDTLNLTRADDSKIAVTLLQVVNPATVANKPPDATKTYVATKLKITDSSSEAIEGDVNINVSMVGSDDQSYTADLSDVTDCTNFESGAFHLGAGESATGCVVFALPHGVTPARVKYTPSAGFANDFGEWVVSGDSGSA